MAQKLLSSAQNTISVDAMSVLHELMYAPSGTIGFSKLQNKLGADLNCDMKKLALYCFQNAYVKFDGTTLELTDTGLHHYLQQQRYAWN